jgi:hypothetical protein
LGEIKIRTWSEAVCCQVSRLGFHSQCPWPAGCAQTGPLPISHHCTSTIRPGFILPQTFTNHWLNCKYGALLHHSNYIFVIVWHLGSCMKNNVDSMSTIASNNWKSVGLGMLLNNASQHSVLKQDFTAPVACIRHSHVVRTSFCAPSSTSPTKKSLIQVPRITIAVKSDIHINNVTFLQRPSI